MASGNFGDASVWVYSIIWTPEEYDPDAVQEDPDALNESFTANFSDTSVYPKGDITSTTTTTDKLTWGATTGSPMNFDSERSAGGRIKFNGASDSKGETIPTYRYLSFKTTKPGTVTYSLISGNSTDHRPFKMILAKTVNGEQQIVELHSGETPFDNEKDTAAPTVTEITAEHLSGISEAATVYLFSTSGGVNLYSFKFEPAQ